MYIELAHYKIKLFLFLLIVTVTSQLIKCNHKMVVYTDEVHFVLPFHCMMRCIG